MEIFYTNPDSEIATSTFSEESRQVRERYEGRVSEFSLNIDLHFGFAIEFISNCELSCYDKVTLMDWSEDDDDDEFGDTLSDHLIPQLAGFRGELILDSSGEEAAIYLWANFFLQHAPNLKQVTLNILDCNSEWRQLLSHPKVKSNASCYLYSFNPDAMPVPEVHGRVQFLRTAKLDSLLFRDCNFIDYSQILQRIIDSNINTLTNLNFDENSLPVAFYQHILQAQFPLLKEFSMRSHEVTFIDIFSNLTPTVTLQRILEQLSFECRQRKTSVTKSAKGSRTKTEGFYVARFLQHGFRNMKQLAFDMVIFTTEELNVIFASCPLLQVFHITENVRYSSKDKGLPVINDFPGSFGSLISDCHLAYPRYSVAFVLQLLQVPNLRQVGKQLKFEVKVSQPKSKEWKAVEDVHAAIKGGKYVTLLGKAIDSSDDDDSDDEDYEES